VRIVAGGDCEDRIADELEYLAALLRDGVGGTVEVGID